MGGIVRTAIAAPHRSVDASFGQALQSRAICPHASRSASRTSVRPASEGRRYSQINAPLAREKPFYAHRDCVSAAR